MFLIKCQGITEPVFPTVFNTRRDALRYVKSELKYHRYCTMKTAHLTDDELELILRSAVQVRNECQPGTEWSFSIRSARSTRRIHTTPDDEDEDCGNPDDMISYSDEEQSKYDDDDEDDEGESEEEDEKSKSESASASIPSVVEVKKPARGKRGRPTTGQLTVKKSKKA